MCKMEVVFQNQTLIKDLQRIISVIVYALLHFGKPLCLLSEDVHFHISHIIIFLWHAILICINSPPEKTNIFL